MFYTYTCKAVCVLHTPSRGFIVNVMCFDSRTHPETYSTGKSRWNKELGGVGWRGSAAALLHGSQCGRSRHICCCFYAFGMALGPASRVFKSYCGSLFHIVLCNGPLCKSNTTINRFGYSGWFLLSLLGASCGSAERKGELICLLRLNKHLWVADKNTQEAMHPEMMKPHIPLLAPDQVSSGLRLSQLLRSASLSSSCAVSVRPFQFNHFKAEKGNNCSSFFLIIEHSHRAVNYFY